MFMTRRHPVQQQAAAGFGMKLNNLRRRRLLRIIIAVLVLVALLPPLFLHFRLSSIQQAQLSKCGWIRDPPLVCAHGGDTTKAFPNTMAAFHAALDSEVDCIEIDVSRSSDGVLLVLHDRDLQRITGDRTSRVGHLSAREIKELKPIHQLVKFDDVTVTTLEQALLLVSKSVHEVILDAKVGPPSFEDGLAEDILSVMKVFDQTPENDQTPDIIGQMRSGLFSVVELGVYHVARTSCKNCLVWAKSDSLVRDIIKLSSNISAGYIVMGDPYTTVRKDLFRVKGAGVVGVYHPLVDRDLMSKLHRRDKKVYAWTVDDMKSMHRMLSDGVDGIVTSYPTLLQQLMRSIRLQCFEDGFSLQT